MNKLLAVLILTPLLTLAQEDEECIFDQTSQTDEFIKDVPEFSNYTWNDKTKTATIQLSNGTILKAHRGGCVHFGISGTLLIPKSTESLSELDYWLDKSKWIAERLFEEQDYLVFVNSIRDKTYEEVLSAVKDNERYFLFPHEYFNEFSMFLRNENDTTKLTIGYYF